MGSATGSGVVISPDGVIVTAAHVVSAAERVDVYVGSDTKRDGVVVRRAADADLALVRIIGDSHPCLSMAEADPSVGSDIVAVGNPGGDQLTQTVTRGIVSGIRMVEDVPIVQTDAAINSGNSGGPLLDKKSSDVVGIVSFKVVGAGAEGLGFGVASRAVPEALGFTFADTTSSNLEQAVAPDGPPEPLVLMPKVEPGPGVTIPSSGTYGQKYAPKNVGVLGLGVATTVLGAVMVGTSAAYDPDKAMPKEKFSARQGLNTAGWLTVWGGLGVTIVGALPGAKGQVYREGE